MAEPIQIRPANVIVSDDVLLISELIETDSEVVRFVQSSSDPVDAAHRCLRVGARAVQAASAALDSETVRTQFEHLAENLRSGVDAAVLEISEITSSLLDDETGTLTESLNGHRQQLDELLDSRFDPDSKQSVMGKIEEIIADALGRQSKNIRQAVSLDSPDSPLRIMKTEIVAGFTTPLAEVSKQVRELSEKIAVNEAVAPVVDITTAKGFAFEEVLHDKVTMIASAHGDFAEMTGAELGVAGSKKGDEVVTLNLDDTHGVQKRIVFEAKATKLSARATRQELEAALENRAANAAIVVFDSQLGAPTSVPFSYSGSTAIVVLEDDDTTSLRLAYMWARWTVRREDSSAEPDSLDFERVEALLAAAKRAIERHTTIKRGHTQAKKGIDQAATHVALMVDEVQSALSDLEAELTSDNS